MFLFIHLTVLTLFWGWRAGGGDLATIRGIQCFQRGRPDPAWLLLFLKVELQIRFWRESGVFFIK